MSAPRARRLDYAISLSRNGKVAAEAGEAVALPKEWAPEHLVLAGLARCTLASLEYHARRSGCELTATTASAFGTVTRHEEDGRYAFVEVGCRLDVELKPAPGGDALRELLAKAKRDCFVGASPRAAPRYSWVVNGWDGAAA